MSSLYHRVLETGEPTQVVAQYVWGARPGHRDELILRDRDTTGDGVLDERLYCLMDYFNPVAVVDTAGDVKERYAWSAFGVRSVMAPNWAARAASAFAWEFGFHGQFLDGETGWYDYGFRYFSPPLGRWLSKDPIGERGGSNLQIGGSNSFINSSDFYGLLPYENCTVILHLAHTHQAQASFKEWETQAPPDESGYNGRFAEFAALGCNACFQSENFFAHCPGDDKPQGWPAFIGITRELHTFYPAWNGGLSPQPVNPNGGKNWDPLNQAIGFLRFIAKNFKIALENGQRLADDCAGKRDICPCDEIIVKFVIGNEADGQFPGPADIVDSALATYQESSSSILDLREQWTINELPRLIPVFGMDQDPPYKIPTSPRRIRFKTCPN